MFENGEVITYVKEIDVKGARVTTYPMEKDTHYKILSYVKIFLVIKSLNY